MAAKIEVLTVDEVAEALRCSPEAVRMELEGGRMKGFQIGGEWRTTEADVLSFVHGQAGGTTASSSVGAEMADLLDLKWEEIGSFPFDWPKAKKDQGSSTEQYTHGFKARVPVGRDRYWTMTIGFATRKAAGMDRARVVLFWGAPDSGKTMTPIVEFVGANDYETSRTLASVIKRADGKHVRPGEELPEGHDGLPTGIYNEIVDGPYAARSLAVVAKEDARSLMAKHALLRSRMKGWI